MSAQPQRHSAQDRGDQARQGEPQHQAEPGRIALSHGEPGGRVGGDADERGLAERQHAADAGNSTRPSTARA